MAAPPKATIFASCCVLVIFFMVVMAAAAGGGGEKAAAATCVPTLQRLLACLDYIEHRTEAIPAACCVEVNGTVAEQPCCLMHVLRGDVAKLMGPEFDTRRAMVDVTVKCLGDAALLTSITRSCAGGQQLPPLTPEYPFTTALPASSSAGVRLEGSSYTILILALLASYLCQV